METRREGGADEGPHRHPRGAGTTGRDGVRAGRVPRDAVRPRGAARGGRHHLAHAELQGGGRGTGRRRGPPVRRGRDGRRHGHGHGHGHGRRGGDVAARLLTAIAAWRYTLLTETGTEYR